MGRLDSWSGLEEAQKKAAQERVEQKAEPTPAVVAGGLRSPKHEQTLDRKDALPVSQQEIMPREFGANQSELMRIDSAPRGAHRLTSEEQKAYAAAQLEAVALQLQAGEAVSEGDNADIVNRNMRAIELINGLAKSDELNPYGQVTQIVDKLKADIIQAGLTGENETAIARMRRSLDIAVNAQTVLKEARRGLNEGIDQEVYEKYPAQYDPSGLSDEHKNTRRQVLNRYIREHNQRIIGNAKRRESLESA